MADDRYLVRRYIYIYFRSPKVEANSCNLQMLKDNQRFLINFAKLLTYKWVFCRHELGTWIGGSVDFNSVGPFR